MLVNGAFLTTCKWRFGIYWYKGGTAQTHFAHLTRQNNMEKARHAMCHGPAHPLHERLA